MAIPLKQTNKLIWSIDIHICDLDDQSIEVKIKAQLTLLTAHNNPSKARNMLATRACFLEAPEMRSLIFPRACNDGEQNSW